MSSSELITTTEHTELTEKNPLNTLTHNIIGAAIEVHRALGPGLLESAYEACLIYELKLRRLKVEPQIPLPIFYKDVMLDCGYRLDLVIEEQVIAK
jgi:GxxExxY protein